MTVFEKPHALTDTPFHYCPGCTHGIIHRLVAEVLEELGVLGKAIGVAPVGCAVMAYDYFNCDMQEASHGRAPAVATGIKRVHPDKVVFTYQGDGDLASIGTAEIVHAAARGEKFTTIFVNNATYMSSNGPYTFSSSNGTFTKSNSTTSGTMRCVYDTWYWKDKCANASQFIWGADGDIANNAKSDFLVSVVK